jgi:hypothetical protein
VELLELQGAGLVAVVIILISKVLVVELALEALEELQTPRLVLELAEVLAAEVGLALMTMAVEFLVMVPQA